MEQKKIANIEFAFGFCLNQHYRIKRVARYKAVLMLQRSGHRFVRTCVDSKY